MCGIFAVCQNPAKCGALTDSAKWIPLLDVYCASSLMHSRGPDMRSFYQSKDNGNILFHERLAINDLECTQPIQGTTETRHLIHNGEIYNHEELKTKHVPHIPNRTTCDSEIVIQLYEKFRDADLCNLLDGVFAIALVYDDEFFAARDPIGVKPMYWGNDQLGRFYFASEMKALQEFCLQTLDVFPPGHYYTPRTGFVRYYEPVWMQPIDCFSTDLKSIRGSLIAATHKRLMSDVPLASLLSGGLDSSLICAIAARELCRQGRAVRTFAVGLDKNSPDLVAARKVAEYLGTEHTEVYFTVKEALALLPVLVYHLESYDVTTVRAATPMYFLTRRIAQSGVKVVLSGEGADEIFGGYLYFHNAPTPKEFHDETVSRVCRLPYADVLRADKSCMANGVELRVPFLDKRFLDVALQLDPKIRMPTREGEGGRKIEKWALRKAFDDKHDPFIPEEILWRQKEQFSDGVGYTWIDSLKMHAEEVVTDAEMANALLRFPFNTPKTKEAFLIRRIFEQKFPSECAQQTVQPWVPKWQEAEDPSGRYSAVHLQPHHPTNGPSKQSVGLTSCSPIPRSL